MAKLFVTGAAEYVGPFLIDQALLKQHTVTAIGDRPIKIAGDINFQVRDAARPTDYAELLRDHDVIIHLDPRPQATAGIVEAAKQTGVTRLLQLSRLGARPQSPVSTFTRFYQGEQVVKQSGLSFSIFKPSLIYGPQEPVFTELVKWLRYAPIIPYVQGWGMLQPVDVHDLVEFMLASAVNPETAGHSFEIGGTERISMGQLIDALLAMLGKRRIAWPWFVNYALWVSARIPKLPFPLWHTLDDVRLHNEQLICNMRGLPYQFKIQLSPLRDGLKKYFC